MKNAQLFYVIMILVTAVVGAGLAGAGRGGLAAVCFALLGVFGVLLMLTEMGKRR